MANNSRTTRELRKRLSLSDIQKATLIGSLLGDGYLSGSLRDRINYRLEINHSVKQREYVLWKYEIFSEWILSLPKYRSKTRSLRLRTISHPELTFFHELFYSDGRKIIPNNIGAILRDPLTLAVWFMDDGTRIKDYGVTINSQSFNETENNLLQKVLLKNFGISSSLHNDKGNKRLYIGRHSVENFIKIVNPFVLPSMKYKFPIAP